MRINHPTAAVMALAAEIDRLGSPDDVVAALVPIAARAGLEVYGAWRCSTRPEDWGGYRLGQTVFSPMKNISSFLEDLRVLRRRHGPSVTIRRVWQNRGSFTLTEAMRDAKASGDDRYIANLFARYGIRDAFYCPIGPWVVLYTSPKVLKLPTMMRAVLQFAATLVAVRLETLTRRNFQRSVSHIRSLTAREYAVLYQVALGKKPKEIGAVLEIAPDTVWTFLRRAQKKLGARTPTHAVAIAMMRGMIITLQIISIWAREVERAREFLFMFVD